LRRLSVSAPDLIPWGFGVNAFASVAGASLAPLIAMHLGFSKLMLAAGVCYLLAALAFRSMPEESEQSV